MQKVYGSDNMKVYYESQQNWGENEYYYLHRVLHKMFYYYDKYADEISELDVSKMSANTRVLIYCIIKYYKNDFLFERFSNIKPIADSEPLKNKLVLDRNPLPEHSIYSDMNVVI